MISWPIIVQNIARCQKKHYQDYKAGSPTFSFESNFVIRFARFSLMSTLKTYFHVALKIYLLKSLDLPSFLVNTCKQNHYQLCDLISGQLPNSLEKIHLLYAFHAYLQEEKTLLSLYLLNQKKKMKKYLFCLNDLHPAENSI